MPSAAKLSKFVFASPRPTHTEPSRGLVASAPIESLGRPFDQNFQWPPRSVDFQTPPSAAPAKIAPPAAVNAVIRPVTRPYPEPKSLQTGSRYPGTGSFRNGLSVSACHVPPCVERRAACAAAAEYAAAETVAAGAVFMYDSIAARSRISLPSPPSSSLAVALCALVISPYRGPRCCCALLATAAGTTANASSIPAPAAAPPARRNHELRLIIAPFWMASAPLITRQASVRDASTAPGGAQAEFS